MPSLILLIGPQGAGKTTYARAHFPGLARVSQDDQGRNRHFSQFQRLLAVGESILIDRINYEKRQRLRYVLPAREAGYGIHYVWLDADRHTCLKRLGKREAHPTVRLDGTDHEKVLDNYFRNLERPEPDEYDKIEVLAAGDLATVVDLRKAIGDARTWIIGDVHGCFDELDQLLRNGNYREGEVLVFTGDLVNRGPQVAETLDFVRSAPDTYAVMGNHDERFARHLAGRTLESSNGLSTSIRSIESWATDQREDCRRWLEGLPYILRLPDFLGKPFYVLHAGIDGDLPMDRQTQFHCLQARYFGGRDHLDETHGRFWYHTLSGDRVIAFGHIPHADPKPIPGAFALDGSAVKGGVLRALIRSPKCPEGQILEVPGRTYRPRGT